MKKILILLFAVALALPALSQSQHMKFMGIDLNCTISTFTSKLKGKGFEQDMSHKNENSIIAKGVFAGEKVKVNALCASKTHLVYRVNVCFNMSSSYTYEELKKRLMDKYGSVFTEHKNVKDDESVYVKYTTDYSVWEVGKDEISGEANLIVLTKCSYRGTSPFVISYIDTRNAKIDLQEINSDF